MKKILAFFLIAIVSCANFDQVSTDLAESFDPNLQFLGFLGPVFKSIGGFLGKAFGFIKNTYDKVKPIIDKGKQIYERVKPAVKVAKEVYNRYKEGQQQRDAMRQQQQAQGQQTTVRSQRGTNTNTTRPFGRFGGRNVGGRR